MIALVDRIKKASRPDQENTPSTVKEQNTLEPTPAAIPAPSPPGMGPAYDRLWNEAWRLADWIDDPDGAPIEDRRAKLAELDQMRDRMEEIARQAIPIRSDSGTSPPGTWMPWESTGAITRDTSPDTCPARCRRTGKCYALAYFKGKAGKPKDCEPDGCTWEGGNK